MDQQIETFLRNDFDRCWVWLEPALVTDIGGASHTKEDILEMLLDGRLMLFSGSDSAFMIEFMIYPLNKRVNIWIGGGNMKQMLNELLPKLETFARENGFDYIQSSGRAAWGRAAARFGFKQTHVTFAKEL